MSFNKDSIEWCNYTFNPISGCQHGCSYCYAKELAGTRLQHIYPYGFEPTFYPERLKKRSPKGKIFVGSMGDLFGNWNWRVCNESTVYPRCEPARRILEYCKNNPQSTFIFLTKSPKGMQGFTFPKNCWCGVTVTKTEDVHRIETLSKVECKVKFVSFEPLLEPIQFPYPEYLPSMYINWVIIGSLKGEKPFNKLSNFGEVAQSKYTNLIMNCNKFRTPTFVKDSVIKYLPDQLKYREFPQEATK